VSAIVVDRLSKTYPGAPAPALDEVSLTVEPGQIAGLLGPNGAGKSTLVGSCTTRVVPSAGRVWISGLDVAARPIEAKRHIGVVPQHNTLDRSVSVWENIYLHCRYYGIDRVTARRRAGRLLDTFALAEKAKAAVTTLSGGQARRLQLARALAHRPDAVFLDEPTVGLDPQSRQTLWDLIESLAGQGAAVVVTTHYMDEADRLCDTVAVIDHGRVIAQDSPDRLKAGLQADTTVTLTVEADADGLARKLQALPTVRNAVADPAGHVRVLVTGRDAAVATLVEAAVPHHLTGLSADAVSLEAVFLTLTGRSLRD
jgi:ABC-2 type transport system ATP-binding protein